ncbi:long-chain fatty acid--CoA ligase [Burkholderia contaminans FFH2055]|uniref:3-(methylthio)propionyl-CoA ligase n=1 Tax=Burkholderia contaminans TaxID=488447 RepID=UPI000625BCB8|nr:3-(methylthio)propionyl-CoA ligase [Burkholderia contaminans]KKL34256.1 long-chain fatty acid--CoA ligase [Burkholderia contaminans FFH2055]MEB4634731.1 3-(methylthio)propionyl-CoA ligase [Burkholderia contaminans]MEB4641824.1 3-(methylthio)propionyl-CoA ligase [Burkholderia contaminans]MEB4656819.1 3-(methylthio)propionyl-CoA ligase [Burkholderia contaminans]MEB4664855.1 3-(methylthio)propionyl-CoA ligase [Burkholderia contaminans]
MAMTGRMMSTPLLISSIIRRAARYSGGVEIVSRGSDGGIHRYTYRECELRARKLAQALEALGVRQGDRIGTLAWNSYRHLELYYAVPGAGAVCHTINPRLFPEQIVHIVNDAEDTYVCFDVQFLPLVEEIAGRCPGVKGWIMMAGREDMPAASKASLLCYEELIGAQDGNYEWPVLDENLASGLCYTSGTTGNPKGVLYSHRSTVLHSYASALPDSLNCSASEVIMPVVPMFHVNAWELPYSAPLVGAKLVLPGQRLDGASLYELIEGEQVTYSAGVPTVWLGLLEHVRSNDLKFSTFRRTGIGGSAVSRSMIRAFKELGVDVAHGWGMTETSAMGASCTLRRQHAGLSESEQEKVLEKQGAVIPGIDMKIVDGQGHELPWDGKTAGDLFVRGPWIIDSYYGNDTSPLEDGWFPTGDVATIDADGYMHITDRSKDVVKSGGEWISSIDIENIAAAHPAVHMAACIAVRHPKWGERPLLVAVKKADANVSRDELLQFFEGKVAKWWVPDDVVFVDAMPMTATGKFQKAALREQFKEHRLPTA